MLIREGLGLQIDMEDKDINEAQLLLNSAATTPERLKEELRLGTVRRRKALQNMDGFT
jgi:hypothetical protein